MSIHDVMDLFGEISRPRVDGILKQRFLLPPFTVLSARDGDWQERKRMWLSLGIKSEQGRGENLTGKSGYGAAYAYIGHRGPNKGAAMTNASGRAMEIAGGFKARHGAAPGGSLMPAMDYSNRARGNGKGQEIPPAPPAGE